MRATPAVLALAGAMGCGGPKAAAPHGSVNLVKATGQILSGTKPAAGALLLFHPVGAEANTQPPRARAGPDGKFHVVSADGRDGLPEGDYVVTVDWRAGSGENGEDGRSLAAERYARPNTSPLKAAVRVGPDGSCVLPTFILAN